MNPPTFKPVYQTGVTVNTSLGGLASGSSVTLPCTPQYCLSKDSAAELLKILQAAYPMYPMVLEDHEPTPMFAGPNHYSADVPWIRLVNLGGGPGGADQTYLFNCGQFADYWASASMAAAGQYRDLAVAWRNAQQDISLGLSYQG